MTEVEYFVLFTPCMRFCIVRIICFVRSSFRIEKWLETNIRILTPSLLQKRASKM
jgi:uncharacterized membrane protein YbaN (DUF454 family)